jgi:hypothetical protein
MSIGSWGISFASNLTPDATGTGNWTIHDFRLALKEGKYKGIRETRNMLPTMPWQNYADMPDDDIEAIFVFLQSLSPVNNLVPQPFPLRKLSEHAFDTARD